MNQISRRSFIKNTGGASVALWLGISAKGYAVKTTGIATAKNFTPYILVESKGSITLYNTKPEMGQGTFQSIPALIAEEFEVSLDQVTIKLTNGEKEFGNSQSAGGSSSVRTSYTALRKIGASAKEVFIQSAATKWQVDVFTCYAENGKVMQHNFYDSPVLRINEVPEVEVLVLADGGRVKGVGEPGVPPFAPALANAIFAATGKRIRKMPFDINDI